MVVNVHTSGREYKSKAQRQNCGVARIPANILEILKQYPMRLLLVEDHTELAEMTAQFLRRRGLEVQVAESGKKALETARDFRPEIVLCDLSLPDISGLDLVRALRANPDTKDVVFALHSALSDIDLRDIELEFGDQIDVFLSKPLTNDKLNKLLASSIR